MGRVTWAVLGWAACAAAWWLGAPWPVAVAAAALYGGAWLRGVWRVAALLLAPLVVAWARFDGIWAAAGAGVAVLAVAPLWLSLGGRLPWRGMAVALGAGTLVMVAAWASPWRASLFFSDAAARAQVLLLAALALAYWPRNR